MSSKKFPQKSIVGGQIGGQNTDKRTEIIFQNNTGHRIHDSAYRVVSVLESAKRNQRFVELVLGEDGMQLYIDPNFVVSVMNV